MELVSLKYGKLALKYLSQYEHFYSALQFSSVQCEQGLNLFVHVGSGVLRCGNACIALRCLACC